MNGHNRTRIVVPDVPSYQKDTEYLYNVADVRENISALQQKKQVWTSGKKHTNGSAQNLIRRTSSLT